MAAIQFLIFLFILIGGIISIMWPPDAPWFPTRRKKVRKMLVLAEVDPGDVIYDLGSGDGRMIIMAAREFGARSVGIEIDSVRYLWSQLAISVLGLRGQVRVINGNFFNQDLSQADVIMCYLLQKTNDRLGVKLERELAPGTRVISNTFTFPGWQVSRHVESEKLYLYIVE